MQSFLSTIPVKHSFFIIIEYAATSKAAYFLHFKRCSIHWSDLWAVIFFKCTKCRSIIKFIIKSSVKL